MNKTLPYLGVLDGVRGVAALMVMIFHFKFLGGNYFVQLLEKVTIFGQTGVDLFFVLSGFLITRILIQTRGDDHYFLNFYVRRSLRIFPLYYLFLCLTYFVLPFIQDTPIPVFREQVWFWVYLQNLPMTFPGLEWSGPGHFWSLAIEEHFYLLWPFLVFVVKDNRKLLIVSCVLIAFALLFRWYFLSMDLPVFYFTLTRVDSLAIGTVLAILERQKNSLRDYRPLFVKLLLSLGILLVFSWFFLTGLRFDYVQVFKFTLIGLFYFAMIGLLVSGKPRNIFVRIFNHPFLKFTGKISYGLYVCHLVVFMFCRQLIRGNLLLTLVVSFAATYLVATLLYYLFELKILRLKNLFEYGSPAVETRNMPKKLEPVE